MKKILLTMLCLATYVSGFADGTSTTVYYAVPANKVNNGSYSVKLNINYKGDGDEWEDTKPTMSLVEGKTYHGKLIYTCTFTDKYNGLGCLEFMIYNGSTATGDNNKVFGDKDWHAVGDYNGKMYEYGSTSVRNYNYDKTVTIHALKKDGWSNVYICHEYNDYGSHWDTQVAFPGTLGTQSTLNGSWYDLTVTGRPCTRVVTSNGSDGEGNRSGNNEIGDAKEYWITYDGSTTSCTSTPPASFTYTRSGLSAGKYGTICLPYAIASVTGAKLYRIASKVTGAGGLTGVNLAEVTSDFVAGYPYIFEASSTSFTVTFSGNSTTTAADANGLQGNLSADAVNIPNDGTKYVIQENKVKKVVSGGTGVTCGQYRAYITLTNVSEANAPGLFFIPMFGGETTGITTIENGHSTTDNVFNLNGQRVNNAQKGIFIKNGRKIVMK